MGTLYEEIPLDVRPSEVLDTIRRSAASQKLRVSEIQQGLFVTDAVSFWTGHRVRLAVWVDASPAGAVARFLALGQIGSEGETRKFILRLIDAPLPVYGPPGAPLDPTAPRDLYRPLGTGGPAPEWVRRTNYLVGIVSVVFFAAFVAASYFWRFAGIPLLWLAFLSPIPLREFMFRRSLHLPPTDRSAAAVLFATILLLFLVALALLESYLIR